MTLIVAGMYSRDSLAAKIKADLLRPDRPRDTNVTPCATCGRPTLVQDNDPDNTFCQPRCKEALEIGLLPPFAKVSITDGSYTKTWRVVAGGDPGYMPRPVRMGKEGFLIACANCKREFDCVDGHRCCSAECERSFKAKERRIAIMAEADMVAPAKRKCQACGADIADWRDGRRVRQDSRFCSRTCAQKSRRNEADISET